MDHTELTPDLLLTAYANGIFPMAESRNDDQIFWVDPERRGIFPLDNFHISKSLARKMRRTPFDIRFDTAFRQVVEGCADRTETWINTTIFDLYAELFDLGFAHSVEVFEGDTLVGGVYGVTLGSAFFGESMFSKRTDASKIALAYLVTRLTETGYTLFDTQFLTPHLASLGAIEISRAEYRNLLLQSLQVPANFSDFEKRLTPQDVLQANGQMS